MPTINTNALIDYLYPSVEDIQDTSKHATIRQNGEQALQKLLSPDHYHDGFEDISQDRLDRLHRGYMMLGNTSTKDVLMATVKAPRFPQQSALVFTYLLFTKASSPFTPLGSRQSISLSPHLDHLLRFLLNTNNPLHLYALAQWICPPGYTPSQVLQNRVSHAIQNGTMVESKRVNLNTLLSVNEDTLPNELQVAFDTAITTLCEAYIMKQDPQHKIMTYAVQSIIKPSFPWESTDILPVSLLLKATHAFNTMHELTSSSYSYNLNPDQSPLHQLKRISQSNLHLNKPTTISPLISHRKFYRLIITAMLVDEPVKRFSKCIDAAIMLGYKRPKCEADTLAMAEVNYIIQCLLYQDLPPATLEKLIQKSRLLAERLSWDFTKTREEAMPGRPATPIQNMLETHVRSRSLATLYFLLTVCPEMTYSRADIFDICQAITQPNPRGIDINIRGALIKKLLLEKLNDSEKILLKTHISRHMPSLAQEVPEAQLTDIEIASLNKEKFERYLETHTAINKTYPYAINTALGLSSNVAQDAAFPSRLLKSETPRSFPSLLFLLRVNQVAVDLSDRITMNRVLAFTLLGLDPEIDALPANEEQHLLTYKAAFIRTLIDADFRQNTSCMNHLNQDDLVDNFGFADTKQTTLSDNRGASFEANRLAKKHLGAKLAEGFGRHELKQAYMHYIRNDKAIQFALRQSMILGKPCLMLNVLQSHASDLTLNETKELVEARALLHKVPLSNDTLDALRASLVDSVAPTRARNALLLLALSDHPSAPLTPLLINQSLTTPEAKASIIEALKLLSPEQISTLKFKLNTLVTENDDNKSAIKSLIDNKQSEQCPLLLALKIGKTKHKIKKRGNFYTTLDQFLHAPEKVPSKNLTKYGLFQQPLLPENEKGFELASLKQDTKKR